MLIIFPKPKEITGFCSLAVNLNVCDEIVMNKNNETNLFHIALLKHLDAHGSNQSTLFYILGIFADESDCYKVFQNIVDALNADQKTFELPSSLLQKQPELKDQTKTDPAYL